MTDTVLKDSKMIGQIQFEALAFLINRNVDRSMQ